MRPRPGAGTTPRGPGRSFPPLAVADADTYRRLRRGVRRRSRWARVVSRCPSRPVSSRPLAPRPPPEARLPGAPSAPSRPAEPRRAHRRGEGTLLTNWGCLTERLVRPLAATRDPFSDAHRLAHAGLHGHRRSSRLGHRPPRPVVPRSRGERPSHDPTRRAGGVPVVASPDGLRLRRTPGRCRGRVECPPHERVTPAVEGCRVGHRDPAMPRP